MSMLAERRQRKKWSINPRGNDWLKDSNKFGQKMLEKMGWKPGKGLGLNEQGIKEAIKPKVYSDAKGLGYSEFTDPWILQQEQYSDLLSKLNIVKNERNECIVSLEEKSKSSNARVHYHKFIRGKDVSRYSKKDLLSIFGIDKNKKYYNQLNDDEVCESKVQEIISTNEESVTGESTYENYEYTKKKRRRRNLEELDNDINLGVMNQLKKKKKNKILTH